MSTFTPESLVKAVTQLFELNHYEVTGPVQIHGAEVDLIAKPKGDPFGRYVCIEVTIEYVDNSKYGKDVGKLALVGEVDRDAQRLIVSSEGFSLPVKERARMTRIETLTYDELFRRFEKFESYLANYSIESDAGKAIFELVKIYEPPHFEDAIGSEYALDYLTSWKNVPSEKRWLIITGEYGTGKTALTKVLHQKWLEEYKTNPASPIPFRIELRSFSRQFDARGLLHHFLDRNNLSHVPIEFVESLVRSGRVVLLLDGYDEMAQYFNSRERRQCLEALASLSADGARGILTSRPNYFTLTEELQVFETLYSSIKSVHFASASADVILDRELQIDRLLEKFLDRYERNLRDLTREQTNSLVERILADDPDGLSAIKNILAKIFRNQDGTAVSLSGKPVIVSYLVEVVEQLKKVQPSEVGGNRKLGEWEVYKLIVNQLMLRDLERSPEILPTSRRTFLHRLGIFLSKREHEVILEADFKDLVATEFRRDLARLSGDARTEALLRYFSDLRSSATLTRSVASKGEGWRFSHNSIREFLIAEHIAECVLEGVLEKERIPISDAMRTFAASMPESDVVRLLPALQSVWRASTASGDAKGQALCLFWDAFLSVFEGGRHSVAWLLERFSSVGDGLTGVSLSRISLSSAEAPTSIEGMDFRSATLSSVSFDHANLKNCNFSNSVIESTGFIGADLTNSDFSHSLIVDANFAEANLSGARFTGIEADVTSILVKSEDWPHTKRLSGQYALGYLRYEGALTDIVSDYYVFTNHPRFDIVKKIISKLSEQAQRQRIGLEQRGAAHADVPFARAFVSHLIEKGFLSVPRGRKDIVEPTERGRQVFQEFVDGFTLAREICDFLERN